MSSLLEMVESERDRDGGVARPLDVRAGPIRRDVHRDAPAQIETGTHRGIPLAERIAGPASHFDPADPVVAYFDYDAYLREIEAARRRRQGYLKILPKGPYADKAQKGIERLKSKPAPTAAQVAPKPS